jgi:hypothetical protein
MENFKTCYMCDSPSTSREHVPPRSLFPEAKDVGGDYRNNLITVPSCDLHNSGKSRDDEFLMVSLAGIIGNNSIGYLHRVTKVNRAVRRSSMKLLRQASLNQKWHSLEIRPNKFIDVIWGTPDYERFNNCFDRITRGLFLDSFGDKFLGTTKTMLGFTLPGDSNGAEFQRFIRDRMEIDVADKPRLGANPDIFAFRFTDRDEFGLRAVHLQFYGGLDVYVALIPSGTDVPYNLGMALMADGIKTTITLGHEEYNFNVEPES